MSWDFEWRATASGPSPPRAHFLSLQKQIKSSTFLPPAPIVSLIGESACSATLQSVLEKTVDRNISSMRKRLKREDKLIHFSKDYYRPRVERAPVPALFFDVPCLVALRRCVSLSGTTPATIVIYHHWVSFELYLCHHTSLIMQAEVAS